MTDGVTEAMRESSGYYKRKEAKEQNDLFLQGEAPDENKKKLLKLQKEFQCYLFNHHHHIITDYEFKKEGIPYVDSFALEVWFNRKIGEILSDCKE